MQKTYLKQLTRDATRDSPGQWAEGFCGWMGYGSSTEKSFVTVLQVKKRYVYINKGQ